MVLVFFRGLGEWLIRDGNNVKLAITRTTEEPYKDPRQHKRRESYCPDYDEWLGLDEDNDENFAEWTQLYESTCTAGQFMDNQYEVESKDYKYDRFLGGIFVRDPDVRGDIYSTEGLRCIGVQYISCPEKFGVFRLDEKDEESYRLTSNWEEVKKMVKTLLPCTHPNSAFAKEVADGNLSNSETEKCYFEIQDKQFFSFPRNANPEENKFILNLVTPIDSTNVEP